jgi:hypothetical protein
MWEGVVLRYAAAQTNRRLCGANWLRATLRRVVELAALTKRGLPPDAHHLEPESLMQLF